MKLEVQRPRELGSNRPCYSNTNTANHSSSSASLSSRRHTSFSQVPPSATSKVEDSARSLEGDQGDAPPGGSPKQRIEKLSVSPWKPSRRQADGQSLRPVSFISQVWLSTNFFTFLSFLFLTFLLIDLIALLH